MIRPVVSPSRHTVLHVQISFGQVGQRQTGDEGLARLARRGCKPERPGCAAAAGPKNWPNRVNAVSSNPVMRFISGERRRRLVLFDGPFPEVFRRTPRSGTLTPIGEASAPQFRSLKRVRSVANQPSETGASISGKRCCVIPSRLSPRISRNSAQNSPAQPCHVAKLASIEVRHCRDATAPPVARDWRGKARKREDGEASRARVGLSRVHQVGLPQSAAGALWQSHLARLVQSGAPPQEGRGRHAAIAVAPARNIRGRQARMLLDCCVVAGADPSTRSPRGIPTPQEGGVPWPTVPRARPGPSGALNSKWVFRVPDLAIEDERQTLTTSGCGALGRTSRWQDALRCCEYVLPVSAAPVTTPYWGSAKIASSC